ncbi:hypothetical protein [Nocardioides solisilvae]|uniref:hypothetical protein n=1 Tax=Nocardioides solisilvae TaxID=1542435 RepID=UPI000D746ED4|nr:hypothetical protein [Nocardioides solisilvae]
MPAATPTTTQQRILEAAALLPERCAVTGWAALHWLGATWFDGTDTSGGQRPVPLATGGLDLRVPPGVSVCAEHLPLASLVEVDGVVITLPERSVGFEMRYAPSVRQAAVTAGMAAYDDLVDRRELALHLASQRSRTGVPRAREAYELVQENWWSPAEAWTEMVWILDAGLPRLRCNVPVFDRAGRFVATPDLLDEEAGLAIDYDGAVHLDLAQRHRDLVRTEALRALGLRVLVVMAADHRRRGHLVHRMLAARRAARFEAESSRRWTTDPPGWWRSTLTVADRRALSPEDRARWLRYRLTSG